MILLNWHSGSDIKDLLKNTDDKSSFTFARRMFSKFKVATLLNTYHYQLPIVEVYEAEIRKLRCENLSLKVLVIQLNEVLAQLQLQQEEKEAFRSMEKEFSSWLSRRETLKNGRLGRWYFSSSRTQGVFPSWGMFIFVLFYTVVNDSHFHIILMYFRNLTIVRSFSDFA